MSTKSINVFLVTITFLIQQDHVAFASVEECINNLHILDGRGLHNMQNRTVFAKENSLKILAVEIFLNDISYRYMTASMKMAYEDFCKNAGVPGVKTELILVQSNCNPSVGVPLLSDMREAGMNVILGIRCSKVSVPAGYLFSHWNIPMISSGSNNPDVDDKDIYQTLVRVGMGYTRVGYAVVEIFKTFKWTQASLLSHSGLCSYGINYVNGALKEQNLRVSEFTILDEFEDLPDEAYDKILDNFRERARVLIFCLKQPQMLRLMEIAKKKGMVNSEFVFLTIEIYVTQYTFMPWGDSKTLGEAELQRRQEAFQYLKIISPMDVNAFAKPDFVNKAKEEISTLPGLEMNVTVQELEEAATLSLGLYFYDMMSIYLNIVNETRQTGQYPPDGKLVFDKFRNLIIQGKSGEVIMNDKADRIPIFWLWQIRPGDETFNSVATLRINSPEGERVHFKDTVYWGTSDGLPPPDEPVCGFRNELCPPDTSGRVNALIGGFTALALVIIIGFSSFIYYKKKQFEKNLQKMSWKILYEEINFLNKERQKRSKIGLSFRSIASAVSQNSDTHSKSFSVVSEQNQIFTTIGAYKGATCAIKKIHNTDFKTSREDLIQLKLLKDLNHENLNTFLGICPHVPTIYILTQYCSRGSLQDILEQDEIKLDWMFKSSLIQDLTNGMAFLHDTKIGSHGNLKSPNCLIDGRWMLKVSNFGLQMLRPTKRPEDTKGEYENYRDELWTAPELLRMVNPPRIGNQKGDVYSFAIILQEILYRALPYFTDVTPPEEVISKVKAQLCDPYRPEPSKVEEDIDPMIVDMMKECWEENPATRPEFIAIKRKLAQMNKGKKVNILDNMVAKLESYANNLEDIVEKRTEELVEEKKKTDLLLYRMLPSVVADKLKHGLPVAAEIFESVSIYFSDVVGFTNIASDSTPVQIVNLLNDLYTLFDASIAKYDVYKVETIGDAYMCVSGLPKKNGHRHATEIADMSLDLRSNLNKFKIRHIPDRPLMIRIGLHSGSCAAGVVGLTMPRYCLFGDTVNVASRMESNGEAMKIHISETTFSLLKDKEKYVITARGQVDLKGKGLMDTFWLDEKRELTELSFLDTPATC